MANTEGKKFDNKAYQREYHRNMKTKLLSFNLNNAEDMMVWDFLMSKGRGKVFPYIKSLILKDMNQK